VKVGEHPAKVVQNLCTLGVGRALEWIGQTGTQPDTMGGLVVRRHSIAQPPIQQADIEWLDAPCQRVDRPWIVEHVPWLDRPFGLPRPDYDYGDGAVAYADTSAVWRGDRAWRPLSAHRVDQLCHMMWFGEEIGWSWRGIGMLTLLEQMQRGPRGRPPHLDDFDGQPLSEERLNFGNLGEVELLAERLVGEQAFVFSPLGRPRHQRDGFAINIAAGDGALRLLIYCVWHCGVYDARVRFSDGRVGTMRNLPGWVLRRPQYRSTCSHRWHVEIG
jgi:hypothetical protein